MVEQRRLAAILAADMVGYSRLMEADESGTITRQKAHRAELIDPKITEHNGRIVKTTGDGMLVEFASVVDAVSCAVAIQTAMAEREANVPDDHRIQYRIGINIGDIVVDGDDIFGDGVNVAARIEGLCLPGEIYLSGTAHNHVSGKLTLSFENLGEQNVKNIAKPIQVYRVKTNTPKRGQSKVSQQDNFQGSFDKPSIAVLPFDNLSGDPEQEYFSDGITEDIITALSQIRQFFVIARNTTFVYKGRPIDVKQIAEELGVRYILEGSVRKAGKRVRITAQLIDGDTGNHLWAQRYDRDLEDIFAVQDEITVTVVGAIQPELEKYEQERARLKKPDDPDAWDHCLKGNWHFYRYTKDELERAKIYYNRAIETDRNFGPAYVGLAETFVHQWGVEPVDRATETNTVLLAEKAVQLDNKDARARQTLGWVYLYMAKDTPAAIIELKTALELNPSLASAYAYMALAQNSAGNAEIAIDNAYEAIRLSPFDPRKGMFMTALAQAHLCLHQHEEAVKISVDGIRQFPESTRWIRVVNLVSALGHLGRLEEAAEHRNKLLELRPEISLKFVRDNHSLRYPAYQDHFIEGLRKAGVPEN